MGMAWVVGTGGVTENFHEKQSKHGETVNKLYVQAHKRIAGKRQQAHLVRPPHMK
jgi:hypothetical protein